MWAAVESLDAGALASLPARTQHDTASERSGNKPSSPLLLRSVVYRRLPKSGLYGGG